LKKLAQWSVNNRVAVNLIMMFIIVAGLLTVMNMRREMFPQFALDMINVCRALSRRQPGGGGRGHLHQDRGENQGHREHHPDLFLIP
jgi:hypothetical protein